MSAITQTLRRAVADRAAHRCEYCGIPDDATLAPHEPDHVIGEQHGGPTTLENLAYACFRCNRFKGPNIATRDPDTGDLVPLFNPRTDRWESHFGLQKAQIAPRTPVGRGTTVLLRFNDLERTLLRTELIAQGRYSVLSP